MVKLLGTQKSILDYVGKSLERFKTRVGRDERGAIDGHFTAIRTLETELGGLGGGGRRRAGHPGGPGFNRPQARDVRQRRHRLAAGAVPEDHERAARTSRWLALTSGVTRVATLQLSNSAGNYFNFGLYVPACRSRTAPATRATFVNFHDAAHNPVQGGIRIKELVDKWFMDQFAIFLGKAKAVPSRAAPSSTTAWSCGVTTWVTAAPTAPTSMPGSSPARPAAPSAPACTSTAARPLRGGGGKSTNNCMADICKAMGVTTGVPAHWTGTVGLAV